MKLLRLEFYKCRRRKMLPVCAGWLGVELLWIAAALLHGMDETDRAAGWQMLLYQLALIDAVTLPVVLSALISRECEMEHAGVTLKLLETLTTPGRLYAAKLAWYALITAGLMCVRAAVFALLGAAAGFAAAVPAGKPHAVFPDELGRVDGDRRIAAWPVAVLCQSGRSAYQRDSGRLCGAYVAVLPGMGAALRAVGLLRAAGRGRGGLERRDAGE